MLNIQKLIVIGGCGKSGEKEAVERVVFSGGTVASIVGPTGSGKTALINDIALFANQNTPSKRRILINGKDPLEDMMENPSQNPIALITQHTNFLSDLPVGKFLQTHAAIRHCEKDITETLSFANQLTGEPININSSMTELSGGQTRALLIADAVIIGNSPIILLDEIENAGIYRAKALELLKGYKKLFIFVTHDPFIALLSDFRIIMKNGAMQKLIFTNDEEKTVAKEIKKLDEQLTHCRDKLRNGEILSTADLELN